MILLVIDVQNEITNEKLYNFEAFLKNMKRVIQTARENQVEVVYIRHNDGLDSAMTPGKAGFEIYAELAPLTKERVFDKTVNSAFKDSGLLEYLNTIEEKELIITGLQTDYCMDASIKCAFDRGFHVIVPSGTNSTVDNSFMSGKESYRYYNEFMWKHRYAECLDLETVLASMKTGKIKKDIPYRE